METNCSPASYFDIWLSHFPSTIYWKGFLFSSVYFWLLCQKLFPIYMWFYFWALNSVPLVCVCFSANSMLLWLSLLCSKVWSQELWIPPALSLFFSSWGLLWLFMVFCGFIQILWFFILFLQKMTLGFWWGLH